MTTTDPYAASEAETSQGKVFTVTGQDWDSISEGLAADDEWDNKVVVNMGPQHPSTHGVLRLILELEGETVTEARCGIGYLHTGIEKNMEFRTWTQGVTFCTRMDYLSPFYNETTYVLGVEKLLGITDDIPEKATVMRVLMMELNRISSHLVCIATGGMEIGALTVMTIGFRERELVLDLFELITGLRMNHAFIRPGGVSQDMPPGALDQIRDFVTLMKKRLPEYADLCNANPIFKARLVDVGHLDLAGCLAIGMTGPVLRSTGYAWDLRKTQPYCGYEDYDFDVCTWDTADAYGRFRVRLDEMWQSLRIVEQCVDRLGGLEGAPVMVGDKKIAWPSQLSIGSDGMGNSLDHIKHIMGESMEALIHHFKLVTEGFRVPAGQAYVPIESPARRARRARGLRRRHPPVPGPLPRPVVRQPPGDRGDERGRHGGRRDRRDRLHRPGDGRGRSMSDDTTDRIPGLDDGINAAAVSTTQVRQEPLDPATYAELEAIAARYPQPRSGLLPMLHLVQSIEGQVSSRGIEACAEILGISAAEVSGVATFYTMYKRRPVGDYHVGVCTNTLCAVMGGDLIFERLKGHLDVGNDETTPEEDGRRSITLEHIECNAACDYAPVMTVNWEFMDNMTPQKATDLVDDLRSGAEVHSTRGPRLVTWREAERVLAGFPDGLADEGVSAGVASLVGLAIARSEGWTAPTLRESQQSQREADAGRGGHHRRQGRRQPGVRAHRVRLGGRGVLGRHPAP